MGIGTVGRRRRTLEKDQGRDSWEKSAQGMGPAGGPSSTREWARREARRVGAEQRDNPSARWDWAPAREPGLRDSPGASWEGGRVGQSRREQRRRAASGLRDSPDASWEGGRHSPGASSGTIVGSDIGRAQGQLTWTPNGSTL